MTPRSVLQRSDVASQWSAYPNSDDEFGANLQVWIWTFQSFQHRRTPQLVRDVGAAAAMWPSIVGSRICAQQPIATEWHWNGCHGNQDTDVCFWHMNIYIVQYIYIYIYIYTNTWMKFICSCGFVAFLITGSAQNTWNCCRKYVIPFFIFQWQCYFHSFTSNHASFLQDSRAKWKYTL